MSSQDDIFRQKEGDAYFQRNRNSPYLTADTFDWPCHLLATTQLNRPINSILELGCFTGFRLDRLRATYPQARLIGVDASEQAIAQGRSLYPHLELHQGTLADCPIRDTFDVVIVHFVLHWVDRSTLLRSIAQIDERVSDGGYLILGDFLPGSPVRRPYHHSKDVPLYTYKQDYAKIFESNCLYRPLQQIAFNHDTHGQQAEHADSQSQATCVILRKSLNDHYLNS